MHSVNLCFQNPKLTTKQHRCVEVLIGFFLSFLTSPTSIDEIYTMELVLHWQIYVEALPLKKGSENRTSHDVGLVIGSECLLI